MASSTTFAPASGAEQHHTGRRSNAYRPHIDGLRTVAVYLVVAFHAGVDRLAGGFIGVDVFFVLSGYLVTQLLLRDLDRRGTIALGSFYARRARRLLPAAAVALVATALVVAVLGAPSGWADARDGVRAASLYVANWFFIARATDYFASNVAANPVLHYWSLSVEEQFYLLWPALLLGLHRVLRGSRRALQVAVVVGAVASLSAALSLSGSNLPRAYYGTDTRAYQLLAGVLLALAPGITRRAHRLLGDRGLSIAAMLGLGGLAVSATSFVSLGPVQRGLAATVIAVVVIIGIDGAPRGLVARLLSLPPLPYLGRISYGTYLWHWPIIVVVAAQLDLSTPEVLVVGMVGATAMASLSYQVLEQPVLSWVWLDRRRALVIGTGLVSSLLVGLVVAPAILNREPSTGRAVAAPVGQRQVTAGAALDWEGARNDIAQPTTCDGKNPTKCVVVDGSGPTMLLLGDSHAQMLIPTLVAAARNLDLKFAVATRPQCAWFVGLASAIAGEPCDNAKDDWYGPVLDKLNPDIVVLAHQLFDDARTPNILASSAGWVKYGEPGYDKAIATHTDQTIAALRRKGRSIVIVEPIPQPVPTENPLSCLADTGNPTACRYVSPSGPGPEERYDRSLDKAYDDIFSLDLDRLVCPYLPICDPVVGGQIVMRDQTHLTASFATSLGGAFADYLLAAGVVKRS
ncbi:MAG: acyltransferase family protein [Aquihabitans sp.]